MKRVYQAISATVLALTFISCNDIVTPEDADKKQSKGGDFIFSLPSNIDGNDITGRMMLYQDKYYDETWATDVVSKVAKGNFWYSGSLPVNAGTMSINSTNVTKIGVASDTTSTTDTLYTYESDWSSIPFTGESYSFSISGANGFPSTTASVTAPTGVTSITSHSHNQSISKASAGSGGLTVTWSGTSDTTNQVRIVITASNMGIERYVDDTGSYTFSQSDLNSLTNGNIYIDVARGRYSLVSISGGKYAVAAVFSAHRVKCSLTN